MFQNLIIHAYNPSDEKKWIQYRLITFHNSTYYDDDCTLYLGKLW